MADIDFQSVGGQAGMAVQKYIADQKTLQRQALLDQLNTENVHSQMASRQSEDTARAADTGLRQAADARATHVQGQHDTEFQQGQDKTWLERFLAGRAGDSSMAGAAPADLERAKGLEPGLFENRSTTPANDPGVDGWTDQVPALGQEPFYKGTVEEQMLNRKKADAAALAAKYAPTNPEISGFADFQAKGLTPPAAGMFDQGQPLTIIGTHGEVSQPKDPLTNKPYPIKGDATAQLSWQPGTGSAANQPQLIQEADPEHPGHVFTYTRLHPGDPKDLWRYEGYDVAADKKLPNPTNAMIKKPFQISDADSNRLIQATKAWALAKKSGTPDQASVANQNVNTARQQIIDTTPNEALKHMIRGIMSSYTPTNMPPIEEIIHGSGKSSNGRDPAQGGLGYSYGHIDPKTGGPLQEDPLSPEDQLETEMILRALYPGAK